MDWQLHHCIIMRFCIGFWWVNWHLSWLVDLLVDWPFFGSLPLQCMSQIDLLDNIYILIYIRFIFTVFFFLWFTDSWFWSAYKMASRLPKTPTSKTSSSFGSTESLTTSDTASSVDVGSKIILSKTSIPKTSLSLKLSSDSVDDFAVDEKVWVNGSRPGIIRFIGDTKFSSGKWIGVQITSPDGKNDGTVAGVRYFACPNNCGVFVKPQRLTKAPMPESVFQK